MKTQMGKEACQGERAREEILVGFRDSLSLK